MSIYQDFEYSKSHSKWLKDFFFFKSMHRIQLNILYVDRDGSSSQIIFAEIFFNKTKITHFESKNIYLIYSQNAFYCFQGEKKNQQQQQLSNTFWCFVYTFRIDFIELDYMPFRAQDSVVSETLIPCIYIKIFKCFAYLDDSIKYYTIFLLYCWIWNCFLFSTHIHLYLCTL